MENATAVCFKRFNL